MPETTETLLVTERFSVVRHRFERDGQVLQHDSVQHPGAVTILPIVDRDHVCLIRNYRVAVGQTLIELPAGTLRPGESSEVAARRELAEETGYRCGRLTRLQEFLMSPGILNERMHVYLAEQLSPGEPSRDAGEEISNLVVPWPEAMKMAEGGVIQDAKTLVALLSFDRARSGRWQAPDSWQYSQRP